MTVQKIEFSGRGLSVLDEEKLIDYFGDIPHLVASYKIFPEEGRRATLKPTLVVETKDLTDAQLNILAVGIWLVAGQSAISTPSSS
jgi:hypothetical protein